ncbi:unnamed protein product, partial [Allacma fusca]
CEVILFVIIGPFWPVYGVAEVTTEMFRIIHGVMKYREAIRQGMVQEFSAVRDHPDPKAVFFTCMDSRMIPTRFTQTHVGDMFIVRNAGNLVPHSKFFVAENTTTEPAALELGCVINKIQHVVVCGHSDCKAMNLLYTLKDEALTCPVSQKRSALTGWLCNHGLSSLEKLVTLQENGFDQPLLFEGETPLRKFVAYIDPENKFTIEDKLSQVNCLQQLQNIASYGFMRDILMQGKTFIHAMWFDIYTGDIYYFSRQKKQFVEINEENYYGLLEEVMTYYSQYD